MPEVTCPSCRTRQAIDPDTSGYTCRSCGADWDFVTCTSCASRFHAAPDASTWRCPNCGTENTRSHVRAAVSPVSELPIGPNRLMVLGAVGIIILALATWALTRGDDGGAAASPTPSASPAVDSATTVLCDHLVDIQTLRFDAIGKTASTLRDDAAALEAEGDAALAADVRTLARRVATLGTALDTPEPEDDQAATEAVLTALEPIPC